MVAVAGSASAATLGEDLVGAGFKVTNISALTIGTNTINGAANIVGDVNINGNIYASNLGGAINVNAANVSAGVFGSLTGGGNYTFPAGIYFQNTATDGTNSVAPSGDNKDLRINGERNIELVINEQSQYPNEGALNVWNDGPSATPLFKVLQNGKVGIGTASPEVKLHETITGGNQTYLEFESAGLGETYPTAYADIDFTADRRGFGRTQFGRMRFQRANGGYNDNTGSIQFYTGVFGGTLAERMRIDATGYIGIGTPSPGTKLHIRDSVDNKLRLEDTRAASWNYMEWYDSGARQWYMGQRTGSRNFVVGRDQIGGVQFSIAAADGNVGIKKDPTTYALDVNGTINATDIRVGGTSISDIGAWTKSGSNIYYTAGNVGIGIASPSAKLQIHQGTSQLDGIDLTATEAGGATHRWKFYNMNGYVGRYGMELWEYKTGTDGVECGSSGGGICAPQFVVRSGGNVGIGATSPVAKLDTRGQIGSQSWLHVWNTGSVGTLAGGDARAALILGASDTAQGWFIGPTSNTTAANSDLGFYKWSGISGGWGMVIGASGNVGIGITNPGAKLEIAGDEKVNGVIYGQAAAGSGDVLRIGNDTKLVDINIVNTAGLYGLQDSTIAALKFGSGGGTVSGANNGIGINKTPAAGYALDVLGTVNATDIKIGGTSLPPAANVPATNVTNTWTTTQNFSTTNITSNTTTNTTVSNSLTLSGITGCTGATNVLRLNASGVVVCGTVSAGGVSSVFGRTGSVVAATGDYSVSQITGAAPVASPAFTGTFSVNTPSGDPEWIFLGGDGNSTLRLQSGSYSWNATVNSPSGNIGWMGTGNFGIGTPAPGYKLDVVSAGATTARFGTASTDKIVVGGGAGKIDAGTVDPVYTIEGKRYATYMAGMTGVKEETTGVVTMTNDNDVYKYTIDFAKQKKGSDLWLFAKTTNLEKRFEEMAVLLTPEFDGRVWYEKDVKNFRLVIYGDPISGGDRISQVLSASYRLTAPRFDAEKWGNTSDAEYEGMNLDNQ